LPDIAIIHYLMLKNKKYNNSMLYFLFLVVQYFYGVIHKQYLSSGGHYNNIGLIRLWQKGI